MKKLIAKYNKKKILLNFKSFLLYITSIPLSLKIKKIKFKIKKEHKKDISCKKSKRYKLYWLINFKTNFTSQCWEISLLVNVMKINLLLLSKLLILNIQETII